MNSFELKCKAAKLRYNLIAMLAFAGSGHPGGSLSLIEILTALYYGDILKYNSKNPKDPKRDRLVMSKGHGSPTLYLILADLGFFPISCLREFDVSGSMLPKHCNRFKTPGIEASTGALGQGISIAIGMALAEKLDRFNNYRVFTIASDGECQSGNLWEAAMSAAKFKLDNLIAIVDYNKVQIDGTVEEVMPIEPLRDKWESFGWFVIECDGHEISDIINAFHKTNNSNKKPSVILAHTIKGKGVSFMEFKGEWHSAKIPYNLAQKALLELEKDSVLSNCKNLVPFLTKEELNAMRMGQ